MSNAGNSVQLATSPMMQSLEALDIRGAVMSRETIDAIVSLPAFQGLRSLRLSRVHRAGCRPDEKRLIEKFGDRITFL